MLTSVLRRRTGLLFCLLASALALTLSGCKLSESNLMFQKLGDEYYKSMYRELKPPVVKYNVDSTAKNYVYKIKPNDQLEVLFLNLPIEMAQMIAAHNATLFTVDYEGYVTLPFVNKIQVKGMTIPQLQDAVQQRLAQFYKDPSVGVSCKSMHVTVLGQVQSPGMIMMTGERIHLTEALAEAGGVTRFARTNKVKIIRPPLNDPQIFWVDMYQTECLADPHLSLRDGDIVYVPSRSAALVGQELQLFTMITNAIGIVISLFILIRGF